MNKIRLEEQLELMPRNRAAFIQPKVRLFAAAYESAAETHLSV